MIEHQDGREFFWIAFAFAVPLDSLSSDRFVNQNQEKKAPMMNLLFQ